MANYFGGVWESLVLNTGSATSGLVHSLNWRFSKTGRQMKYVSRSAYKSVLVHVAKQLVMSTLEGELNSIMPRFKRLARDIMLETVRLQQDANQKVLIQNGQKSTEGFGRLKCAEGVDFIAKNKYGVPIPEALFISYTDTESHTYNYVEWTSENGGMGAYKIRKKSTLEKLWNPGNEITDDEVDHGTMATLTTKTLFHLDLAPQVTMSSNKNLVLTEVQGRDFSRKELVSGGDLTYSVSGSIDSGQSGVYPSEAVKRFVKIMQYGGILDVNYITFGLLGVKRVIVKDFSLGQPEYKNIQPYSFSCVAVEPDDVIQLATDTIGVINSKLAVSPVDKWYNLIINNKLVNSAVTSVLNTATSAATTAAGSGLDELTTNI